MNKLAAILISTIILPLTGTAQLLTVSQNNSGAFYDLVSLMSTSVSDLYTDHNSTQYTEFVFTTDGFFSSEFVLDGAPYTSFGFDIAFREVANFDTFVTDGLFNVGFFGNESADRNRLILNETFGAGEYALFDYRSNSSNSATPAPSAFAINPSTQTSVSLFFSHQNPLKGIADQSSPVRFKIFEEFDPISGLGASSWIFAIDDREDQLIDFDDGFFYLSGSSVTPVPEPSAIAALSMIGLASFLYIRRRITRNATK